MKKTLFFVLSLALLATGVMAQAQSKAHWDSHKGQFKIEDGAKLTLGIDNDAYGKALVSLWDKAHPESAGAVNFLNMPSADSAKKLADLQGDAPDVVMTLTSDVPKFAGAMAPLPSEIRKIADKNVATSFYKAANAMFQHPMAIPFAYDGMAFAWNKTMLMQLGLISGKVTKDNLPVEFNTWEKIFALGQAWDKNRPSYNGKPVNVVFPVSLDEPWSGYVTAATGAGWEIFQDDNALKPGFEKTSFAKGLQFLVDAAKAKLSVEANGALTPGASMVWRWDPFLNDQIAPFGLVGTWMDVKGAVTKGNFDMEFAPMPTYNGHRLTPFLKVKDYVLNAYSKYPSAAAELLRLIFTKEGMQAMIDNSSYVPALKEKASIAPNFTNDQVKQQMAYAFRFSYVEPVTLQLPANPNKQAEDVYYNIGMNQFYKDVWDGKLTPEAAQTAIVAASTKWIQENNKK